MSAQLPPVRTPHPHVVLDPHGSPVVDGSRIPVRRLYAWFRDRVTVPTMLKRYPQLGPARLFDALAFAYDNLDLIVADLEREKEVLEGKTGPTDSLASNPQLPLSQKEASEAARQAQLALPFAAKKPR